MTIPPTIGAAMRFITSEPVLVRSHWSCVDSRTEWVHTPCPASDSAGEPRRDLLDQPGIAIGILEGKERSVAGALGVGAALGTKLPE